MMVRLLWCIFRPSIILWGGDVDWDGFVCKYRWRQRWTSAGWPVILMTFLFESSLSAAPNSSASPLHIHLDDPTFVPTRFVISSRNLVPRSFSSEISSRDLVWIERTLENITTRLSRLLTLSQIFEVHSGSLRPFGRRHWPPAEVLSADDLSGSLRRWLKESFVQTREDLKLFIRLIKTSSSHSSYKLDVYLSDFRQQTLSYTRSFEWSRHQKATFVEFIYELADDLIHHVSGRPGLYSSRIVFVGKKTAKDIKQIFTCRMDGTDLKQITTDPVIHLSPTWSSDGTQIIYTSYKRGNPDLYIYDTKLKSTRPLSIHEGLDSGAAADPHSSWVAFSSRGRRDADLYMTTLAGGKRRLLIQGSGLDVDPAFSRDGRYLAYVSGRFGNPHIFIAQLKRTVLGGLRIIKDTRLTWAGWYNGNPAFSRDSQKVAFAGYDKDIDRFDIFLTDVDGQNLERLTLKNGDNESPSWSPNDQLIVFESSRHKSLVKGVKKLYIMRRDGRMQAQIPMDLYSAESPDWGPALQSSFK